MHQPAFLLGQNCYDGSYQLTHASSTHATHSFISDKAMIKLIKDKKSNTIFGLNTDGIYILADLPLSLV